MKYIFFYLLLPGVFLVPTLSAHGQDKLPEANPPTVTTPTPEPVIALAPVPGELPTKVYRTMSRGTVMGHVSPFSTWLPMKLGFNTGFIYNENWTWEFEYTQKSIKAALLGVDFGALEDQRYGLQARWYPGANSFHFLMGLFKSTMSLELGNSLLSRMNSAPSVTLWKVESWGPQLGLGNRWQWSQGVTFGVDWLVMYLPLFNKKIDDTVLRSVSDSGDRDDLDKVSRLINNLPQFDLARLHLGYTF